MLLNIHVKNFALIEEADIDLEKGLNILTGETGAGKSILIDAVSAGLGGRLKGDVIGGYDECAFISLVFSIDNPEIKKEIENLDVNTEYYSIIVSRKISPDRSIFKINDEAVTATKVRDVTRLLIDIHGQHEHQSLLRSDVQLSIVDKYADDGDVLLSCEASFDDYKKAKSHLDSFNMNEEQLARKIDYLKFEIDEISNANLKEGERKEIETKYNIMKNSEDIASDLSLVIKYLSEDNENISDMLAKSYKAMLSASNLDPSLKNITKQISDCSEIISDAIRDLKEYADGMEYDSSEFKSIERRIDELNHLESKYGKSVGDILAILDEKNEELNSLENYEVEKEKALAAVDEAHNKYLKISDNLRNIRKNAAESLSSDIVNALSGLNFLNVEFEIKFLDASEGALGRDEVSFDISTNPGEGLKPLAQVASGGELSRIMLGFKSVLSEKDQIETLIFDEIDAGISGKTAGLVAEKLRKISNNHQVICITHLPQIAAMANSHFVIDKNAHEGRTKTTINRLNEVGEIEEIARLLSGEVKTDSSYDAARDLKRLAKEI